uniref:DDE_Tnp_1_7 domain-containing protein n=1 Tax=Heligmosomoides polygyrus TaxID=6339 RepID=A0A183FAN6_HELPZ
LNDVDLDELVEEHDKCESENHPEEEELTIEGKETHKKLSLKDQQKDHKVGKRSAQWSLRNIVEIQMQSSSHLEAYFDKVEFSCNIKRIGTDSL